MNGVNGKSEYVFKVASEAWELEEIFRLNYETFVEELPQHEEDPSRRLIDQFHDENTYFICVRGKELAGMVAVRDKRPFSLDRKLGSVDEYLPSGLSLCEIRLLSVRSERRNGRIIQGLLSQVAKHCVDNGYEMALISGTTRQLSLYERLGFEPFGPIVGTPEASFQPMFRRLETLDDDFKGRLHRSVEEHSGETVNLMPGPVSVHPDVQRAFARRPESHRSPGFVAGVQRVKDLLCGLTNAKHVEIMLGSGTLANDVIAAQLSLEPGRGLILSNGEFGDRLLDQATRFGLEFDALQEPWGQPFNANEISSTVAQGHYAWIWAVHCETSTGVLNDIALLNRLSTKTSTKLALDCISSIGTTPVDLRGVFLASGVSGKGLASYPGLSMVFYNHEVQPRPDRLPRYLDLGYIANKGGVPFTTSSNLLAALASALDVLEPAQRFDDVAERTRALRDSLRAHGFTLLAQDEVFAPAVITIVLPPDVDSVELGERVENAGFALSYNSDYLRERNWIQICLMGYLDDANLEPLIPTLEREYTPLRRTAAAQT